MSLYKEIGNAVNKLFNKQTQIYTDACDYGIPVKSLNDAAIKLIKSQVLPMCNGVKTTRYGTGATQTMKFNGGWPAVVEAGFEEATIEFVKVNNNKNLIGYITVEINTSKEAAKKAREYDN